MARFIYGTSYEDKEALKNIGAKWEHHLKMWYFNEPKNKKEEEILNKKIDKVLSLGFKISDKDKTLQRISAHQFSNNRY